MIRRLLKRIAEPILIPLTRWYLRKRRVYRKNDLEIEVLPGVFHPGLFSSSTIVYEFIVRQDLSSKKFLDMGCGTGFLSVVAAQHGALVTACDISSAALENTKNNVKRNGVSVRLLHSDVFSSIRPEPFDWIVVNPPYYAQDPLNEADYAWKCGRDHRYFSLFFGVLRVYIHRQSTVVMVLTRGCDLERIFAIARENHFAFELILEKDVFFDGKDYLYRIVDTSPTVSDQV